MPITHTAAVRMPAMMTGIASGSSTMVSDWRGVMPTPCAASRMAGSMPCNPVMVLRSTGSTEYSASASTEGRKPKAENSKPSHRLETPASASSSG